MKKLIVCVRVYKNLNAYSNGADPLLSYVMNHDDDVQRRRLGAFCRDAFVAGQMVMTFPLPYSGHKEDL